jgi:hypothetical protein
MDMTDMDYHDFGTPSLLQPDALRCSMTPCDPFGPMCK